MGLVEEMLAEQFEITELTHPVTLGDSNTRGYFDEQAVPQQDGYGDRLLTETTFYVVTGTLADLVTDEVIRIGALGQEEPDAADPEYRVRQAAPVQDGKVTAIVLVKVVT